MSRALLLTFICTVAIAPLHAETLVSRGYEIHYSIVNTSFLTPAVASAYDIVRGRDRALLNLSVRRQLPESRTAASAATIRGTVTDLIHRRDLVFTEIREQDAIYYLSVLQFHDQETLYFDIDVITGPDQAPHQLEFRHTFYRDEPDAQ